MTDEAPDDDDRLADRVGELLDLAFATTNSAERLQLLEAADLLLELGRRLEAE